MLPELPFLQLLEPVSVARIPLLFTREPHTVLGGVREVGVSFLHRYI